MAVYLGGNKVSLHGLMGQIIINSLLPVRFIDYDGTVLHTYSINDFLALESMPSNPEHKGLISQGRRCKSTINSISRSRISYRSDIYYR
jgi:hypothetical protein